jgi:Uma2 family endonuclease
MLANAPELLTPQADTQLAPEFEGITLPPTNLASDEPPLESSLHLQQIILLLTCLNYLWQDRNDYFAAGNLTIYYSLTQSKSQDFRGPDFFVVLDTDNTPRKSWTIWEESGKYPNIIIELLSDSTAKCDRTLKKEIYQDTFRTPDYFWFSPDTLEFVGFSLTQGQYAPLDPNDQGHLWSSQLQLYLGIHDHKLRFFSPEGTLIPTPQEAAQAATILAQQAQATAQQAQATAQQAQIQIDIMAAKLRELGIDPTTLAQPPEGAEL